MSRQECDLNEPACARLRYTIHGHHVELDCHVPPLFEPVRELLGQFSASLVAKDQIAPLRGIVRPYEQAEVTRHLSPKATRINSENDLVELYEDGERFWCIDDRWGLSEINLLKAQWRSWLLPAPSADLFTTIEKAIVWPLAQLVRSRGLSLLPAVGVVRDGWGALILSSFSIEPELTALVHAGFSVVGQSWTAVRCDPQNGSITMLQMPGRVERMAQRFARVGNGAAATNRIDLTGEFIGSEARRGPCDAVLIVSPGRRPLSHLNLIAPTNATGALRQAWPIAELHPHRCQAALPARMAQRCRVFDVQLSRNPKEILGVMEAARYQRTQPKVTVQVFAPAKKVVA